MEAFIKVKPEELGQDLLDKLKSLVQGNDAAEIIIQVRERSTEPFLQEDAAGYMTELRRSIADKDAGRTTVFTLEELRQYVDNNFSQ